MLEISASGTIYLHVPDITCGIDPTDFPVAIAVVLPGADPQDDDWSTATWVSQTEARTLIGPGTDIVLVQHTTYMVWVKVTSNPEKPWIQSGKLRTY